MKNSKLRFIAILTVIAVVLTSCGIGMFVFADTAPDPVVLNNGDGTGNNIGSIYTYTSTYVDNEVTGSKAINMTSTQTATPAREANLRINTIDNPKDITAISMYVELPELSSGGAVQWHLRINEYVYGWEGGDFYAISKDGEFVSKNKTSFVGGFKGYFVYILPADDANAVKKLWGTGINTRWTWDAFMDEFGGLKGLKAYVFGQETGKAIVVDDITCYFDDAAGLADRFNLAVAAPTSKITSGLVAKNQKVDLSAEEGTEIFYTLDGTAPDNTSAKYDANNKPVITTAPATLKAIAYKDGKQSLVTTYKYDFLPDTQPNVTVLNPCEDTSTVKSDGSNDGMTSTKTLVENMSPYGTAVKYLGLGGTGQSMWNVKFANNLDNATWAAHQAFAFWVSVPEGMNLTFSPCINGEKYAFKGKSYSYNTSTQDFTEYDVGKYPKLSGFEGYLIFSLEGECVRGDWGDTFRYNFREFVQTNGFKQICFYQSHSAMYNKSFVVDNVIAIADLNKFVEDMNKEPKRPMAPTADPGADAVRMDTQIFLYAGDGCAIYYTTDGTDPTYENGECTNGTLYETYSMGNGQEDASYIELKKATTIKAIAVSTEGIVSGIAVHEYTIEEPYDGPNVVVVNNGTGEGTNTYSWHNTANFDKEIVDNDSPDGKGMALTIKKANLPAQEITYKVDITGVEQIHNVKGYSYHVTVPDMPTEAHKIGFGSRVNGATNYLYGKVYAISDDGETIIQSKDGISFSKAFSGTVYMIFNDTNAVGQSYGSVKTDWFKFIKANSLTGFGFYFTRSKCNEDIGEKFDHTFVIDDFSLIYDTDKLFEDIGLEGLLATYDAGSFENTNMIVANDCSGYKKNAGLTDFSENLVIERTDYSFDERNLKLTMPEGESFINFAATSADPELVIGAGTAFWVETPKGAGDTELDLSVLDSAGTATEYWEYGDKWYYLIDKYGVISKKTGVLVVPDGFRGWVVIPKENMFIVEKDGYTIDNAELDYNQIISIKVTFYNRNGELTGKSLHIDDISFYTSFADLVRSRALKWEGQVFE